MNFTESVPGRLFRLVCGGLLPTILPTILLATQPAWAASQVQTVEPIYLPFTGPLNDPKAEVSGLTWLDDQLFVLPEDPACFGSDQRLVFFLVPRSQILDYLEGRRSTPLEPEPLVSPDGSLLRSVANYDGLEAVASDGNRVFLTIEAKARSGMAAYLVVGHMDRTGPDPVLRLTRRTPISLATDIYNVGEESLIIDGSRVLTMGEANGRNVNPQPRAAVFSDQGDSLGAIPFPVIEYRVTDATALDQDGRFWVINYFFPPDGHKLKPAEDPEVATFGAPTDQDPKGCVERLLELRLTADDRIERTATPPINLAAAPGGGCRNWEGLVRLGGEGFLLMSDKHPGTLLVYVANPFAPRKEK